VRRAVIPEAAERLSGIQNRCRSTKMLDEAAAGHRIPSSFLDPGHLTSFGSGMTAIEVQHPLTPLPIRL
jgi:hypothetical protein